jgi:hypothetical protein
MVTWGSVSDAAGYYVYRSTSYAGSYSQTGSSISSTSYTDRELTAGTTYYYKVSAYNSYGISEQSTAYSTARTYSSKPEAPSWVSASALSSNEITVMWSSVSDAAGYYVYRSTSYAGSYSQTGSSTSTSYTDSGLTAGTTYYYKVSAYNGYGEGDLSTTYASATTLSASVPGSSYETAITIDNSYHTLTSNEMWFTMYVSSQGSTHILSASDRDYSSSAYTADIVVDVYYYDSSYGLTLKHPDVDLGYGTTGKTISGPWDAGQWYVKVKPYNGYSYNEGTFAIFFY